MNIEVGVVTDRVDLGKIYKEIMDSTTKYGGGAIVSFIGYVKGVVEGKRVYELEYTVYEPYTTKKLEEIAREEYEKYNLLAVRIYHRVGRLKPGEPTIYIVVAGRGRDEAFKAAREILERVKKEPPIFKLEKREDGEYWIIGDHKRVKRQDR